VTKFNIPKLPLPLPLFGSEVGSFTEFTVTQRMPAIARRIITENNFSYSINSKLEQLAQELLSGNLYLFDDDSGSDFAAWAKYLKPYIGQRWLDVPWFVVETYFYRLILAITNYFTPGEYQIDPFAVQKQQGLEASFDSIARLCQQVNKWLDSSQQEAATQEKALFSLLNFALWGNRVDLSLWSAFEDDRSRFDIQAQQAHILVNDAANVIKINTGKRIDFVIDNAGFELLCDLCLVDFLLGSGRTQKIKLHLKLHPTFVSDATIKDVYQTIDFFIASSNSDVVSFANRLQEYIKSNRLVLSDDYFWTSPLPFWEIPESLKSDLENANLIVIKGDANYRRLLGDRHWDFTTNIADIICYLPAPMVALRTLKSEVLAGIKPEVMTQVAQADADWLTNGQWGVIQLVNE
jgi:uncharacterized protein with ATP-grasp and redox domains